jgi:hypothetical protein
VKPQVTYEATPVVWIHVRGEPASAEEQNRAYLPICPRDGGLVTRLNAFLRRSEIYSAIRVGSSGGGEYTGGFHADDAKKIIAFLRKEGCRTAKR